MQSVKVVVGPDRKQLFVKYDGDMTWEGILEAEKLANEIVLENRRIVVSLGSKEDLRRYGNRLRGRWDLIDDEILRIVEVEDFDCVACKGEHVETTKEIGLIAVRKLNALGKGQYDIEFEVGVRALNYLLESKRVAMNLLSILGTTADIAEQTARNLKDDVLDLKKSLKEASKKAIENLPCQEIKGVKVYSGVFDGLDQRELTRKAGSLRKEANSVVILGDRSGFIVMARSDNLAFNVVSLLRKACDMLGGKCGGEMDFAFAGGFMSESLDRAVDTLVQELEKII
jgi:alanyl-tRNA synthetase